MTVNGSLLPGAGPENIRRLIDLTPRGRQVSLSPAPEMIGVSS